MHSGWIAVIALLVFGGVVCLIYLEAKNSCIQYALAPHVTRARKDVRAAGKGLWKGVKWAGTRTVRICFGWWPALVEGAFMVAAWGWAIKFRTFNPKVQVNKASFVSPGLLTANTALFFFKIWALKKHTTERHPTLLQPRNLIKFNQSFLFFFIVFGVSALFASGQIYRDTCINDADPMNGTISCKELNGTAYHHDRPNTGNVGALAFDGASVAFGFFCAWWDGTLASIY